MTPCAAYAELVVADTIGALEDVDRDRHSMAESHRAACDTCQTFSTRLQDALVDATLPEVAPPADAWDALSARIEADRTRGDLRVLLSCTFCHDVFERGSAVFCATCLAPHHSDCFLQHGRCSALGCEEVRVVQAGDVRPPVAPRRRWVAWAGLAVAFAGGAVAAWGPSTATAPAASTSPAAPSSSPPAEEPVTFHSDGRVSVRVRDGDLQRVCELLSHGGNRVLADPKLVSPVTLSIGPVAWETAVGKVAEAVGGAVDERPGLLLIIPRSTYRVDYQNADLRTVIRELAREGGKAVIIASQVSGRVTRRFEGVYPLQALVEVVRASGAYVVVEETEGLLRVVPKASIPTQLEASVFELNAVAPATNLRRALRDEFRRRRRSQQAFLAYDEQRHALVAMATRPTLLALRDYLAQHDAPPPIKMTGPVLGHPRGAVSVSAQGLDLRELCRLLGKTVGRSILVEEGLSETVTLELRRVPWREALDRIGQVARCEVEFRADSIRLTRPVRVDVLADQEDVRTVLSKIAKQAGVTLVMDPAFQGKLTLEMKGIHWLRAVHAIVKTAGDFTVVQDTPKRLRVLLTSGVRVELLKTEYRVNVRSPATSLVRVLKKSLARMGEPAGASVEFTPEGNKVVLRASRRGTARIASLLKKLRVLVR